MNFIPDIKNIKADFQEINNPLISEKKISLSILRLDKIHPIISGNKYFKLHFFLEEAKASCKKIITFGGAYSNHLAATAFAGNYYKIPCIGMIRGEEPATFSHTLSYCKQMGMELHFISREKYNKKNEEGFTIDLKKYGDHILIPEGGFEKRGMKGAALISLQYNNNDFTHICCAVGTGTTMAGLIQSSDPSQKIMGFSAIKNFTDFEQRIKFLAGDSKRNYDLINDYHFGGYAKKNEDLINFMNQFYNEFKIPTDFVYTGKMMFGIFDLIKKNYFKKDSKILCIHTGGLQGNLSLPANQLNF